ncbi:hypothetical protein [Ekhidna sp.]
MDRENPFIINLEFSRMILFTSIKHINIQNFTKVSIKHDFLKWFTCVVVFIGIAFQSMEVVAQDFSKANEEAQKDTKKFFSRFTDWVVLSHIHRSGENAAQIDNIFNSFLKDYAQNPILQEVLANFSDSQMSLYAQEFFRQTGIRIYFVGQLDVSGEDRFEVVLNHFNNSLKAKIEDPTKPYIIVTNTLKGDNENGYTIKTTVTYSEEIKGSKYKLDRTNDTNPFLASLVTAAEKRNDAGRQIRDAMLAGIGTLSERVTENYLPNLLIESRDKLYKDTEEIQSGILENGTVTLSALNKELEPPNKGVEWLISPQDGQADSAIIEGNTLTFPIDKAGDYAIKATAGSDEVNVTLRISDSILDLDFKNILEDLLLEILIPLLEEELTRQEELKQKEADSLDLAVASISDLEKLNYPISEGDGTLEPKQDAPRVYSASEEQFFNGGPDGPGRKKALESLRKSKKLKVDLAKVANLIGFVTNVVSGQGEDRDVVLNDMLDNVGTLLGEMTVALLSGDGKEEAKAIITDYLDKNLSRLAGEDVALSDLQPLAIVPNSNIPDLQGKSYYINPKIPYTEAQFAALEQEITNYQASNPGSFVVVNYSQDIDRATFLSRVPKGAPVGLDEDQKYKVINIVNYPGSILEDEFGYEAGIEETATLTFEELDYTRPPDPEVFMGIDPSGRNIKSINAGSSDIAIPMITKSNPYVIWGIALYRKNNDNLEKVDSYTADFNNGVFTSYKNKTGQGYPGTVETSSSAGITTVVRSNGDNCFYQNLQISWQPPTESKTYEYVKNEVTKVSEGRVWNLKPLFNRDISCLNDFIASLKERDLSDLCKDPAKQTEEANRLSQLIQNPTTDKDLVELILNVCQNSIRKLSHEHITIAFGILAGSEEIKEYKEIAILRLMSAIKADDYVDFFDFLQDNDNKLIKNLQSKMHDKSINPFDGNNYTSFISGLLHMYQQNVKVFESQIGQLDFAENYKLFEQVLNLEPIQIESTSTISGSGFATSITGKTVTRHFEGQYSSSTGTLLINEVITTKSFGASGGGGTTSTKENKVVLAENVPPLSPVFIRVEPKLDLVKIALDGIQSEGEVYIVPAIFLKYIDQKRFNDVVEKGVMITLDVATIVLSGGAAIATKVHWVRRVIAIAEVIGAAGNIVVTVSDLPRDGDIGKAVDAYNTLMLLVGIKNIGQASAKYARGLGSKTVTYVKNQGGLRSLLTTKLDQIKDLSISQYTALSDVQKQTWDNIIKFRDQLRRILGISNQADILSSLKNLLRSQGLPNSILNSLDNWNASTLNKLDEVFKNSRYNGILNEFKQNQTLFEEFRKIEETWYAKFSKAAIMKRGSSNVPTNFGKYVGDIEVTTLQLKLNLRTVSLDRSKSQYIGKLMDEVAIDELTTAWSSGNFDRFTDGVGPVLKTYKDNGYKLVVSEPKIAVNGINSEPDILLFGSISVAGQSISDVRFIDVKFLDDVRYTAGQQEIANQVANSGRATARTVDATQNISDVDGTIVVQAGNSFIINGAAKLASDQSLNLIMQ